MLNVKLDHADTTPFRTFKTAFRSVASFYGRPTSDIVLFSGLPDEISESLELDDVEHLAQRIGLEVIRHGERECREGNFDCPAIIVFEHPSASLARGEVVAAGRELRRVIERRRLPDGQAPASLTLTADLELAGAIATQVLSVDPASGRLSERRRRGWFGRGTASL